MVDTSTRKLVLPAANNSLIIETNGDDWAECFLSGVERIYLGADDLSVILTCLRDTLSNQEMPTEPADGEIEGFPVAWRLSLAEAHHVLYAALSGEDHLLFWQNSRQSPVTIVGVMRLTPEHREQWEQQLKALLHDLLPRTNGHRQFISGGAGPVVAEALVSEALK